MSDRSPHASQVWAELLRGAKHSRIEFWLAVLFLLSGVIGLVAILSAGAFSNNGAGVFWIAWTLAGCYLFVRIWRRTIGVARARAYAQAHGLEPLIYRRADHYPGMLFTHDAARIIEGVRTLSRHFVEIGNFEHFQDPLQLRPFGYVRMSLPRHVPHIAVVARRDGPLLPFDMKRTQRLSLEGDFDRHFTLYAPARYETDALHIFSPDVMERFLADAPGFTCELVDDELYLYSRKPLDIGGRMTIERIEHLLRPLAAKLGHQLDLYADDRVPDDVAHPIAPGGRRLVGPVATAGAMIAVSVLLILVRIYLLRG